MIQVEDRQVIYGNDDLTEIVSVVGSLKSPWG